MLLLLKKCPNWLPDSEVFRTFMEDPEKYKLLMEKCELMKNPEKIRLFKKLPKNIKL